MGGREKSEAETRAFVQKTSLYFVVCLCLCLCLCLCTSEKELELAIKNRT